MLFESTVLGKVEIKEDEVINFPDGLPGLEHCTRFKLFHDESVENPKVFWLQSLDDKDLLFNLVDALELKVNYRLKLSDGQVRLLQVSSPDEISIKVLIYRSGDALPSDQIEHVNTITKLQANLRAPLLINLEKRVGLQIFDLVCDIVFRSPD